jgi:hypothetical protein
MDAIAMAATLPPSSSPRAAASSTPAATDTGKRKQSDSAHEATVPAGRLSAADVARWPREPAGLPKRSVEKVPARGRQNSLRRVKDSTDVLRERSLKRQRSNRGLPIETGSGGREGRQFTVANVGNNGMLYLRSGSSRSRPRARRGMGEVVAGNADLSGG